MNVARSAEGTPLNAIEAKTRLYSFARRWPPQVVLLITFASFYFAIGPGNFFAVDEVMEQETPESWLLAVAFEPATGAPLEALTRPCRSASPN